MPKKLKKQPGEPNRDSAATAGNAFSINSIDRLKAIANPLRQKILEQFAIEPTTTKQVAEKLGYQATRLYHHVAILEQAGLIELISTRQVRGTTEKYFSAVATRMRVDPDAFGDAGAIVAAELAGRSVIESMLGNIGQEVAAYIGEVADQKLADPAANVAEEEILFAQAEIEADDAAIEELRKKIMQLLNDVERTNASKAEKGQSTKKYRLLVGCYPQAASQNS
ncbi:MAG: ArsR/SmtB family transcription factor [Pseudomonadales bacterium]